MRQAEIVHIHWYIQANATQIDRLRRKLRNGPGALTIYFGVLQLVIHLMWFELKPVPL